MCYFVETDALKQKTFDSFMAYYVHVRSKTCPCVNASQFS
jgi:hypothetical protein